MNMNKKNKPDFITWITNNEYDINYIFFNIINYIKNQKILLNTDEDIIYEQFLDFIYDNSNIEY